MVRAEPYNPPVSQHIPLSALLHHESFIFFDILSDLFPFRKHLPYCVCHGGSNKSFPASNRMV